MKYGLHVASTSYYRYALLVIALMAYWVLIGFSTAAAQNIQNPQSAVDNLMRSNLRVDPSTGALQLEIPLGGFRGRGEASLPVALNYSSRVWNIKHHSTLPCSGEPVSAYRAEYAKGSASGWTSSLGWFLPAEDLSMESYEGQTQKPSQVGNPSLFRIMRKYVTLPDGSRHELRRDDSLHDFGASQAGRYYAVDGSRLWLDFTDSANNSLFMPDGSRLVTANGAIQYLDRNGNFLNYNSGAWTDTLGRNIGVPIPGAAPGPGDPTYTLPGGMTYTLRWRNLADARTDPSDPLRYKGDTKAPINCTIGGYQPNHLFSTFNGNDWLREDGLFNPVVLWQIVLPNGTNYTLTYNVFGELDKIVYPAGGSETFGYVVKEPLGGQLDDGTYSQANRGVSSRAVSDGMTASSSWGYGGSYGAPGVDPGTSARSVTAPDNTMTVTWYYKSLGSQIKYGFDDARTGMAREERVYNSSGTMLRRRLMQLAMDGPQTGGYSTATRNARVTKTVEIILDTGGDALAALTELTYDTDLNVTSTKRYGYVPIIQATAQTGDISSMTNLNSTLLRTEETDYSLSNDPNYRARNLLGLPTATRVKDGSNNIVAQSSISYDEPTYPLLACGATIGWSDPGGTLPRGLATTIGIWLNTAGTYLQSHAQYDQCGNPRKSWDSRGYMSEVEYSSLYEYAYPTRTTSPDPDGAGPVTPFITTAIYDLTSGRPTSTTDANLKTTTFEYSAYDAISNPNPFQRLTKVVQPDGGSTAYGYSDTPGSLFVVTKTALDGSRYVQSTQYADGLGRVWRTATSEGASSIYGDTKYDVMGRVWKVSNPYRTGDVILWTTNGYDDLGRILSVATPDGAQISTVYGGSTSGTLGPTVTVTDQTLVAQGLKKRKSVTDALGRLREVYEDPAVLNYLTSYNYDTLDNLTTVTQGGQTRTFVYDSLKRLTSTANPESGTISYQYDSNGNLTRKTDARGIYIDYLYDGLNRNTTVNYSDTTSINPDITRSYDGAINGKGRSWGSYAGGDYSNGTTVEHTAIDSYDALGRPLIQRQLLKLNSVWGPTYQTSRVYNLAGAVTSQTYPSGRTIDYSYDDAGRTLSFTGNLGDGVSRTYAADITYSAFGGMKEEQFGTQTALFHKLHYNVRGQLNDLRLSTVSWQTDPWNWNRGALLNYYSQAEVACQTYECKANSGPGNNGNVIQAQYWVPANDETTVYNWTEDRYNYDSLNRLKSVSEYAGNQGGGLGPMTFTQIFDFDRWGNRTINPATTDGLPETQFTASSATNRLDVAAGYTGRMDYDTAGNLVNDTYTSYGRTDGIPTRLYDAENRLTTAKDGNLLEVSRYSYNADGQRTRRKLGGVETWQVYGMDGELLSEYASGAAPFVATKEYGYRNGELLVTMSSGDDQRLRRFVYALYYGALQRDATAQELTDKTNELAVAGAQSQAQLLVKAKEIARALFVQTTYETIPSRSDTQYVTDLYYAYLQRGPDTSGLGWWSGLAAGSLQNRINTLNAFEASSEFEALASTLYGTATSDNQRTENLVTNFYQGAFSAPPDATQLTTGTATLNNAAALGQLEVISAAETMGRSLFVAQVNDAGLSNTQFVTNLYEAFLQRGPDAGGLAFWSGGATVGTGRQNVLSQFATCPSFKELAGTLYREANWLVADHLGTPRMVVNKSGSLTSVKRHDYLPFGEELGLISGRTTVMGYSAIDNVRQKFTSKERDIETNLDYFGARYYGSTMGRFTTPDPYMPSAELTDPQTWNRYSYVLNNPLKYVDPLGLAYSDLSPAQRKLFGTYAAKQNNSGKLTDEQVYGTLDESQMATYESITHALESTELTDDKTGKSLGNALSLIESVDEIVGENVGGKNHLRLYASLTSDAVGTLEKAKEFGGGLFNALTPNHKRYGPDGQLITEFPDNLRQGGGLPSLQVSYAKDRVQADIDIDYRELGKGHGNHYNSDVRQVGPETKNGKPINNYQRYIDRWPGLRQWWRQETRSNDNYKR